MTTAWLSPRFLFSLGLSMLLGLFHPLPATASLFHLEGPPPDDLGVLQGRLSACPSPAHCASANWASNDPIDGLALLSSAVQALDRTEIVEQNDRYLHATATSRLFGFVDDLELYADLEGGQIQARSISRLGDSDLGVNSKRLQTLHAAYQQLTP